MNTYTTKDAIEFARIAHGLFVRGENAMARATSQAFYNITRNQPDAAEIHTAFQNEITRLSK